MVFCFFVVAVFWQRISEEVFGELTNHKHFIVFQNMKRTNACEQKKKGNHKADIDSSPNSTTKKRGETSNSL
jgi:hypothetical protein